MRASVLRWVVWVTVFAMAMAPVGRPVMALVTSGVSRMVRASDEATMVAQMLSLPTPGLMVSCSFMTVADAMCWLTNPLPAEVVQAAEQRGVLGPVVTSCVDGGWLAVVTQGSCSCFHIDSSNTSAAVMLMNGAAPPICALGHFASADAAHDWLSGTASCELLTLLWESTGLGKVSTAPRLLAVTSTHPGGGRGPHPHARLSVPSRRVDQPQVDQAASASALLLGYSQHGDARLLEGGPSTVPTSLELGSARPAAHACMSQCDVLDDAEVELVPARSPFAVWSARAAMTEHVVDVDVRPARSSPSPGKHDSGHQAAAARGQGGGASLKRGVRPDWSTGSRAIRLIPSYPVDLGTRTERTGGAVSGLFSSAVLCTPSGHAAARVTASEALVARPSAGAADGVPTAKRVRLANEGGAASALNPAGGFRNDGPTNFSRADISRMMAATKRAWEEADAAAERQGIHLRTVATRKEGALGRLAATGEWGDLFRLMVQRNRSTFITGGPGVGKSTFLKGFHKQLKEKWALDGEIIIVAPTGSSAKTANGQTFHSFFGFPRDYRAPAGEPHVEAARLLRQERFRPIRRRLGLVRVLLMDEVSMVPADRFGVMTELLCQSRPATSPPCVVYTFGEFLQLGPLTGSLAFQSAAWRSLFGASMLELTRVHRQSDAGFVQAIIDARHGRCSTAVMTLMNDCAVSHERYMDLRCNVLHLMPRHGDVQKHNADCLKALCGDEPPLEFHAVDTIEQDDDRDQSRPAVDLRRITEHSRNAALVDCVAPRCVLHCLRARVMLTNNQYLALGLYHGSIGTVSFYKEDGTPVVRFEHHTLPSGVNRGVHGVHDAGADWLEVECPPVTFEARMLAHPGAVAVRRQVTFVLGWGITVHRSQSLSLSEAVLDIRQAFGAGMVNAAISRVGDKKRMHVKSFTGSRLVADPIAVKFYREGSRL